VHGNQDMRRIRVRDESHVRNRTVPLLAVQPRSALLPWLAAAYQPRSTSACPRRSHQRRTEMASMTEPPERLDPLSGRHDKQAPEGQTLQRRKYT
jgi:hypothetical protein